ncbi:MAG TPA: histidinol-phosphate transaminase [Sandaracinaceae bacterium LLY-WYZ-13_1]|nr:histidinol-phosphate transaminase [Sandaracinaceae bacterium LLY-WYZ-13_1]
MSQPPTGIVGEALAELSAYRTKPDPAPVKLDANESPWPLPAEARERLGRALADVPLHRYPDLMARGVRRALARRLAAAPDELVLGVGSDEVIGVLLSALGRPRPRAAKPTVLYPTPTFVMYPITARVHGFDPVEVPLADDWSLDVEAILAALEARRPNLVFLATPNNPTGNAFSDDALAAVVAAAGDALVVIDEAYAPFAGRSLSHWVDHHPNVAVLGTLSKIGLAGLRLGWVRLHRALASEVEKARPPYNLNLYAQRAAEVLLEDFPEALDAQVARIVEERERLGAALDALDGVTVSSSAANFFLIEVPDAAATHAGLLERGVQVRRFAGVPRLARHLRVTVGTPEEDDRLLAALAEIL